MAVKLIPNNIDIYQQFVIRDKIVKGIKKWVEEKYIRGTGEYAEFVFTNASLDTLEQECGIKCTLLSNGELVGFEMTNEKQYSWFALKNL